MPTFAEYLEKWLKQSTAQGLTNPVPLAEVYPDDAKHEAGALLATEKAKSWEDLSKREKHHNDRQTEIEAGQKNYRRLCDQIGLVYSPLVKTRRAQLQAVLSIASFGTTIPRSWWKQDTTPVLTVAGWKAHFQACATHAKNSPLPLHFGALERVATTHWQHVEAKAEHGFNAVSYCLNFVNDRKCKYALRQVFPAIPTRGFKKWQEVTLHAVATFRTVGSLRTAAETHVVLKQLTSAYLAVAHEILDHGESYLSREEVHSLEKVAGIVEQVRERNDLFEVSNAHWQTFWESVNANLLASVQVVLAELDTLLLPDGQETDDLEAALKFYDASKQRIQKFLQDFEKQEGDRTNSVNTAFAAQKEFAQHQEQLAPLTKYLELSPHNQSTPDWKWLHDIIGWRDLFERLRGQQKLDIDSGLWGKLRDRLESHQSLMKEAYQELNGFFEHPRAGLNEYDSLITRLAEILNEVPRRPLWLEKKRWQDKISAFPEIKALWSKILESSVKPQQAQRLFCFNLLRLCDPVAKPHGMEFKQTLKAFTEHDEKLASWVIDHMKVNLRGKMDTAANIASHSESELRRLAGLQRIRGTVRELANAHLDYLLAAKPCWLMSPTSLANLIDSNIFEEHGVPFDLVKHRKFVCWTACFPCRSENKSSLSATKTNFPQRTSSLDLPPPKPKRKILVLAKVC